MSRQRFILLLIAALVVITGAVLLSSRRDAPQEATRAPLLPSLAADMASVNAVLIRKGTPAPSLTLHKVGEQWTVAELNDYPADLAKLRSLLLSLRDAKTVEEKTSDPARYATLGVEDPSQPNAVGTEVTIVTPGSKTAVIVGKSVGEGSFVRRAGEARSYSVEPAISVESEARFWIDPRLIDVPASDIERIDVKLATGTSYSLHRLKAAAGADAAKPNSTGTGPDAGPTKPNATGTKPNSTGTEPNAGPAKPNATGSEPKGNTPPPLDDTFALDGVPVGRQALDARLLAPPVSMLTGLDADDVSPVTAIDFSQSSQAVITRKDGAVLTLTGVVIGTKHWLQVDSSKDAALNARTRGRAFEIASYRYDGIFRPVDQLLVPKPTPIPKSTPSPKSAPGPKPAAAQKSPPIANSAPAGKLKTPRASLAP
jgi:hypothetical protein